jgi:putative hemolysin
MSETLLTRGPLVARLASVPEDVDAAQALRFRAFRDPDGTGRDSDPFDATCDHLLVERDGALVCTFRFQLFEGGAAAQAGYTAQVYDIAPLEPLAGPWIEMGRFCMAPGDHDPDLLRLAWGAMTRIVDGSGARLLFGCSSFAGTDPAIHGATLRLLRARHLGPEGLRPGRRAPETVALPAGDFDPAAAQRGLPPLLRTYLMMGGWVSDHAVVDRDMGTLHVFTGVEIDKVPPARAKALRALAGD